jgi:hypothetical protein
MKILTSAAPRSKELEEILRTPGAREKVITLFANNAVHQSNTMQQVHVEVGGKTFSVSTNSSSSVTPSEENK